MHPELARDVRHVVAVGAVAMWSRSATCSLAGPPRPRGRPRVASSRARAVGDLAEVDRRPLLGGRCLHLEPRLAEAAVTSVCPSRRAGARTAGAAGRVSRFGRQRTVWVWASVFPVGRLTPCGPCTPNRCSRSSRAGRWIARWRWTWSRRPSRRRSSAAGGSAARRMQRSPPSCSGSPGASRTSGTAACADRPRRVPAGAPTRHAHPGARPELRRLVPRPVRPDAPDDRDRLRRQIRRPARRPRAPRGRHRAHRHRHLRRRRLLDHGAPRPASLMVPIQDRTGDGAGERPGCRAASRSSSLGDAEVPIYARGAELVGGDRGEVHARRGDDRPGPHRRTARRGLEFEE